ncbi:hypothetical protein [Sulfobacillus harzensis]|uniref:Uncharacterized protein n=1 Tax=Sulfobacillus harzensis TaxID=2729629 RepID=A0A7Y0Q3T7_9FIRM|nr:hypothetical protein [Sulfobacillus harzensis]NMP24618.1 hypothetical protein [Sulfobacillus harzensis]
MSDADIRCRTCGKPLFRFRRPLPRPGSVVHPGDLIPMPGIPAPTHEGLVEWPCCSTGTVELGTVLLQLWAEESEEKK